MTSGFDTRLADGVLRLRFDNPPRNLLHPELMSGLRAELERADGDADVRALVLTGFTSMFER
jgi:enoyl-CoA hydratase/carnithine racemase